jgi:3-dehydroquinate synthase
MERIRVQAAQPYDVCIGSGILEEFPEFLRVRAGAASPAVGSSGAYTPALMIVTDGNVAAHYLKGLVRATEAAGFRVHTALFPPGESLKSERPLFSLLGCMVRKGLARDSIVIALGGGVIGDFAGFAASVYMRGCGFVQVPTSLLAQVDSSVGGKVGINLREGKNLVGSFYSPLTVVCDTDTLKTLPEREMVSGLAEVVKYGLIRDASLFGALEGAFRGSPVGRDGRLSPQVVKERLLEDGTLLGSLVTGSVRIKSEVVGADEREAGLRMTLNFGHTFGHALEQLTGYRRYLHGEAVLLGMKMAVELSAASGMLQAAERERALGFLDIFRVPSVKGIDAAAMLAQMGRDKKKKAGSLRFVLLRGIGAAEIAPGVDPSAVIESVEAVRDRRAPPAAHR